MSKITKKDLDTSVLDVVNLYEYTADEWAKSTEDSLECYKFMLNEQWNDDEKEYLLGEDRAPIVYNMLLPRINNLIGTEQLNRKSIKLHPRSVDYREMAQMLENLVWNVWQTEEFEHYIQKAFGDALIAKKGGWCKIFVKGDDNLMPTYGLRAPDPFAVFPDPEYKDYKMTDCRWIFEERWLTLDEIIDLYGDRDEYKDEKKKNWWEDLVQGMNTLFSPTDTLGQYVEKDNGRYKVLEMQERKTRKVIQLMDVNTNQMVIVLPSEVKSYMESGQFVYVTELREKYIHLRTALPYFGVMLLDEPHALRTDMYDLVNVYSIDYNNKKSKNSSLVYALKDIQKNMNKREIQKTAMLDHAITSPLFFSYEDKETKEDYEARGNKPGNAFLFRSNRQPPFRLQPAQMNPGAWQDIADSEAKMNDVSAINNAMRGQSDYSNESNVLMQTKLSRVAASVNPYYANLSMSRKMIGEYILRTIKQVYGQSDREVVVTDKTNRTSNVILNETDLWTGEVANNITDFEGYVTLDEAEYSPTKRSENFQTKMALVQIIGAQLIKPSWLLKDSDLADIDEQIEYMEQVLGIQADMSAQQQELATTTEMLKQEEIAKNIRTGGQDAKVK
jgi:hypothetical protein